MSWRHHTAMLLIMVTGLCFSDPLHDEDDDQFPAVESTNCRDTKMTPCSAELSVDRPRGQSSEPLRNSRHPLDDCPTEHGPLAAAPAGSAALNEQASVHPNRPRTGMRRRPIALWRGAMMAILAGRRQ